MIPSFPDSLRTTVVAGAVTLACVTAFAASPPRTAGPPPPPPPPPPPLEFVLEGLDLTANQQAQVDTLLDAHHATLDAHRDEAEAAHTAMRNQMRAATFDEAAIRQAAAVVATFQANRAVADAALLRDVRAILTADQRAQLDERLAQDPPPRPPGHGQRRPGGPPPPGGPERRGGDASR